LGIDWGIFNGYPYKFNRPHLGPMLTEAQQIEIIKILELLTPTRLSKMYLKKLQKIKNVATGQNDNRCLCGAGDRVTFYNEFLVWYQKNS
jgi:hypothetical protein